MPHLEEPLGLLHQRDHVRHRHQEQHGVLRQHALDKGRTLRAIQQLSAGPARADRARHAQEACIQVPAVGHALAEVQHCICRMAVFQVADKRGVLLLHDGGPACQLQASDADAALGRHNLQGACNTRSRTGTSHDGVTSIVLCTPAQSLSMRGMAILARAWHTALRGTRRDKEARRDQVSDVGQTRYWEGHRPFTHLCSFLMSDLHAAGPFPAAEPHKACSARGRQLGDLLGTEALPSAPTWKWAAGVLSAARLLSTQQTGLYARLKRQQGAV